ncbi:jg20637 [Pararge aegeria aegeria]|uniref:Jg20637 protein n=1 Tax=Pararge aegeria aegeria TaxID=348720 RepID=A0A8S4RD83_9NEOP|nr:jg20637 [Pararge aegeria aegeria]
MTEIENNHLALERSQLELEQIMQDGNHGTDAPILSPVQIQQEYFENLPEYDWVKYELSNRKYLLQNIAFALFGSPSLEGDMFDPSLENSHLEGYTSRQKERVMNVYEKLCEQSKYSQNSEDIFMSVLLIVCAKPKPVKFYKIEPSNHWLDLHQRTDTDIWCTAVFRVRKCIPTLVGAKTCKVYVDENARVYQDWDSYLTNNTLPKCVIIAPQDGEYQGVIQEGEETFAVKLTVTPSASLGLTARVLSSVDTASTVASIGAVGVLGVAAFTPIGPAVLIGATVATVATGIYGLVRSSLHLHDRRVHEQYRKHGEAPTTLELFQFSAATLFFCHAVVSNRTAQNIIEDAQATTINEYRTSLRSNRHRKMFDKISAESRRVQGAVQGNTEVIKGIKNILNKDQYFADVLKINKDVNQHKLRISMTSDGQVNLNSMHKFNPSELYNLGKEGRAQLFSSLGTASVNTSNVPTRITPSTTAVTGYLDGEEEPRGMLVGIHPGEIIRIGTLLVRVSASGAENVALLLENLSQDVYANLMTVAFNVLSNLVPEEIARLRLLSPDEDLIVQTVKFVFNYLRHQRPFGDPSRETDNGIMVVLAEFFQNGMIRQDTILHLKDQLLNWVDSEIHQRRQQYPNKKSIVCAKCNGILFV